MDRIDRQAYLEHAYAFNLTEQRMIAEMSLWLPDNIIDAHAHCNRPEHVLEIDDKIYHHMGSTFPYFDVNESIDLHRAIFPKKRIRSLRFALPYKGIDHERANRYLLSYSKTDDRVALYGPPTEVDYICKMLTTCQFSALKMYYKSVIPWATRIYHYFPVDVLAVAEKMGIPIVLNLPTVITKCQQDLHRMVTDFPNLRIAIAHLGSSKFPINGLKEAYKEFAACPNVYMDTAMNPSHEVIRLAIDTFGDNRIMYGSDEPICLVRSTPYTHPKLGQRIVSDYPYHWVDPTEYKEYGHLANNVPHAIWQSLGALRDAIGSFPSDTQGEMKEKIFHLNAREFYGFR